jgi:hypothetical protein
MVEPNYKFLPTEQRLKRQDALHLQQKNRKLNENLDKDDMPNIY